MVDGSSGLATIYCLPSTIYFLFTQNHPDKKYEDDSFKREMP